MSPVLLTTMRSDAKEFHKVAAIKMLQQLLQSYRTNSPEGTPMHCCD